jgi:chromodomain-helicase-DNA-binding protein 3/chromodomain-helicase-DNA-binding protein 4
MYILSLQWFKPETFKSDYRPQFEDFRRYVKEFYAILLEYEQFLEKRNIVFCDLDVY